MKDDRNEDDSSAALRGFLDDDDRRIADIMDPLRARYVESDRDEAVLESLKDLHRNACARFNPRLPYSDRNRCRGIGFAIISESGAGKTTTLERIFRDYPAFQGLGVVGSGCPIVSVEAPSPCTLKHLALMILEMLEYDVDRDLKEPAAWKRVRKLLKLHRIFFLHIDEAANVLHQMSDKEKRKIADTLRGLLLSRKWPVQLILSGVPELEELLDMDRQLRRRLTYISFPNISAAQDAEMVEAAIRDYAGAAGLKVKIGPDDQLIGRLCHGAVYQFGLVMEIIVKAIEVCVKEKRGTLTISDFAAAYGKRTMQPRELNPFIARAWDTLDCSLIRKKEAPQTVVTAAGKPARRR